MSSRSDKATKMQDEMQLAILVYRKIGKRLELVEFKPDEPWAKNLRSSWNDHKKNYKILYQNPHQSIDAKPWYPFPEYFPKLKDKNDKDIPSKNIVVCITDKDLRDLNEGNQDHMLVYYDPYYSSTPRRFIMLTTHDREPLEPEKIYSAIFQANGKFQHLVSSNGYDFRHLKRNPFPDPATQATHAPEKATQPRLPGLN